jgi:hypothetical protein
MTKEEKAKELFNEYYSYLKANLMNDEEALEDAKVCALIAIDELINCTLPSCEFGGIINNNTIEYWEEVKQEIEKL